MYMNDEIAQHLQNHDVRPTAVRIMIWKTLRDFDYAFPMADLEGLLPTVDRSTIFRALTLFVDHDLLFSSITTCSTPSTMARAKRNTASVSNTSIATTRAVPQSAITSAPMVHARTIITSFASTSILPARCAARPIASKTKESPRYMYLRDSS